MSSNYISVDDTGIFKLLQDSKAGIQMAVNVKKSTEADSGND